MARFPLYNWEVETDMGDQTLAEVVDIRPARGAYSDIGHGSEDGYGLNPDQDASSRDQAAHVEVMTTSLAIDDRLLTQEDLSERLQIPVRTLEDWRANRNRDADGSLQKGPVFVRLGKHVRYRRVDVEAWLDAQSAA